MCIYAKLVWNYIRKMKRHIIIRVYCTSTKAHLVQAERVFII